MWAQAAEPGSDKWNQVRDELIALNFTINPTLTIYEASRDLMREMNADWHQDYTHPNLWQFFQPSRDSHGSYWFDWTTEDEIAWKNNFRKWMTLSERLQEPWRQGHAGFGFRIHLEGLRFRLHPRNGIIAGGRLSSAGGSYAAATIHGAQVLGMDDRIGSIRVGKLADLVVTEYNPLRNFKVLYGTGHFKLAGR